jgi:signal peptidase I
MSSNPGTEPGAQAEPPPADVQPESPAHGGESGAAGGAEDTATGLGTGAGTEVGTEAEAEQQGGGEPRRRRKRSFWRDLALIVVAALVLTILLKSFVLQVFSIPSASMENTLMQGDRILVSKVVYDFRSIHRGDIVVFSGAGSWDPPAAPPGNWFARIWDDATGLVGIAGPDTDYVKRVIGVPGDHVVCCNTSGQLTVNGVPLSESSYLNAGMAPSYVKFNITVPAGRLWVMGDNRSDSDDSRFRMDNPGQGTIPESAVVGRAFLIIWPLSRVSDLPIPNTFEQAGLSAAAAVSAAPPAAVGGGSAAAAGALLVWRRRRHRRHPRRDCR